HSDCCVRPVRHSISPLRQDLLFAFIRYMQTVLEMEAIMKSAVFLAPALFAYSFSLWAQLDDTGSFPKEFRKWAHVTSVVVGPLSAVFPTEGGIQHIYANDKALVGYESGKFPDGSIIVYDLLETKEIAGNTIEGPTRRVDVMVKQNERDSSTGGWQFMSF